MDHFKPSIAISQGSGASQPSLISSYQHHLNLTISEIIKDKEVLLGKNICENLRQFDKCVANKAIEDIISQFIQNTEVEILTMNDWNLDLGTGSDILDMTLKLSNEDYDF